MASLLAAVFLAATALDAGVAVRGTHAVVPALSTPGVVILDVADKDRPAVSARVAAPDLGGLSAAPVSGVVSADSPAQVFARMSQGFWTVELGADAPRVLGFVPVAGLERLRWDGTKLLAVAGTSGALVFRVEAGARPVLTPGTADAKQAKAAPAATPKGAKPEAGLSKCPEKFQDDARDIIKARRKGAIENLRCDEFIAPTASGALARWRVVTYTRKAPGAKDARPERVLYDVVPEREKRGFLVIDPAP